MTTEPTEEPSVSGAVNLPEGAEPPPANLGELAQRLSALESRVATLEGKATSGGPDEGEDKPPSSTSARHR